MRAQSQYLRLYDTAGATYHRWQNFHAQATVTWQGAQWNYLPFNGNGVTSGQTGDESGVSVTLPATPLVVDAVTRALSQGWLFDLRIYQFDANAGVETPQAGQSLVVQFFGAITGCGGSLTELQLELGSATAPVGAQIPPRALTTRLIGTGCRL